MATRLPQRQESQFRLVAAAPGARVPRAAVTQTARAAQGFATVAMNTAIDIHRIQERARLQREATSLSNEANRQLSDLEAEIDQDPDFDQHSAQYQARALEIRNALVARADPQIQPDIDLRIERMVDSGQATVDNRVRRRQIDAGRAAVLESEELNARRAALAASPEQRALAMQAYEEDLAGAVEQGFFTAQEGAVRQQEFRERTDLVAALELVNRVPGRAAQMLSDPKQFPDLDPLRREQLRFQATRAALADNRLGAELSRNYLAAIEAGANRDPERERAIVNHMPAPRQAGEFAEAVERSIFVRDTTKAVQYLPPTEQATALGKLRQDPNAPGFSADRQEDLIKITQNIVRGNQQKAEDPRAFVQPLVEEDMRRYAEQGLLVGEDEQRVEMVSAINHQRAAGVADPLPLSKGQVAAEAQALERADAGDAAERLSEIVTTFGTRATEQISAELRGRRPHLALAVMHAGRGADGIRTAEEVIEGARILDENKDLAPTAQEAQQSFNNVYPNLFDEAPEARASMMAATTAIYAKSIAGTDGRFDIDLYEQSARRAGGAVLEADGSLRGGPFQHQGRTVLPVTPGMGEDETLNALNALNDEELVLYGNAAPVDAGGGAISARDIQRFGELISFGFGRYMVQFEGRSVMAAGTDDVYMLDLAKYVADRPGVIGRTQPQRSNLATPELLP